MSDQSPVDALPLVATPVAAPDPAEVAGPTPATHRFHACRWHKGADTGVSAHCTHRDVLPMAGVAGFSADAWCTDCSYYKLRRTPKKTVYS